MHTKVDLQIAQCVHGVCALQSSSLCHIMPYFVINFFSSFAHVAFVGW